MRRRALVLALLAAAPAAATERAVLFDFGSAALSPAGLATVSDVAAEAAARAGASVAVVGHTDTVGGSDANLRLSRLRAQAVGQALIDAGVPAPSVVSVWRGQGDLAVPTADNVREARNRRVVLSVVDPPAPPTP